MSLAFASQGECEPHSPQMRHWKRRAASLESETEILGRIIRVHEATLEEISELVFQQLERARQVTTHTLMSRYNHQQYPSLKDHATEQLIHQEIAAQIEQLVSSYRQNFVNAYEVVLAEHHNQINRHRKELREESQSRNKVGSEQGDCDTSIQQHPTGRALFEIPIEMQILKEVVDTDVQVDLLSSKSLIFEVPVEMHDIVEVPVELNHIFEVPVELNQIVQVEKYRVFEVPVEIEQILQVPGELGVYQDEQNANKIFETPIINEGKINSFDYERENAALKAQIQKLVEEVAQLKQLAELSQKKIYEIPVQIQPIEGVQLNSSRCEVYLPNLESQTNLQKNQQASSKYDSIKHAQSKISTQICTRPDLDISPIQQQPAQNKNSIILSHPTPIPEKAALPVLRTSSLKNINFYVSESHISQVQSSLEEGSEVVRQAGDVPVQIEMDGETIEIEMQIVQQAETIEQGVQTDPFQEKTKNRIAKMPVLKIVEVPYQVEKVVDRIFKVPTLKVVEVPVEVDAQPKEAVMHDNEEENGKVTLNSANTPQILERIVEVPKIVVVQVPVEVVVQKVIVKQVPIEVVIQKVVELPPRTIIKELPMEVVIEKQVIIENEVIVEKIVQAPPRTILKEIPTEVVVQKPIYVELPSNTIIKQVPVEVIVEKQIIVEKIIQLPAKTIIKEVPIEVFIQRIVEVASKPIIKQVPIEVIVQKIVQLPPKTIIKEVPIEVVVERQVEKVVQKIVDIVHEVPVEVIVQKIVQVKKVEVRDVPMELVIQKQVIVEREVIVEKEIKVPVIRQVPVEVIVKRVVEVPVFIEIPVEVVIEKKVPIVKEIPYEVVIVEQVQKIRDVIKVVKQIVEVPVMICIEQQAEKDDFQKDIVISAVPQKDQPMSHQLLLQSHNPNQTESYQPSFNREDLRIIEQPVELIMEKDVIQIKEVPVELLTTVQVMRQVPKIIQIPTEVVMVEQQIKIVEIEKQKIVYVDRPIYVQKIVEVPVEVVIEKETVINNVTVVQVPVEVIVYKDRLIEVPVEVVVEKTAFVQRIVQIPIQLQLEKEEDEERKEIVMLESRLHEKDMKLQANNDLSEIQKLSEQNILDNESQSARQQYEIVCELPEGQNVIYQIDGRRYTNSADTEIIIQIPAENFRGQVADNQSQTDSLLSQQIPSESHINFKLNSIPNAVDQIFSSEVAIQTEAKFQKVKIIQMPIEVENINYEQLLRQAQSKYRDYLVSLKQRYGGEITQLSKSVVNLQSIILQANAEKETLKQKIQADALREQSLLKELQLQAKEKQEADEQLNNQIILLKKDLSQLQTTLQLQKNSLKRSHDIPLQINTQNRIFQVMVEVQTVKDTTDFMMQTDDIEFAIPQLLEIPVELQIKQILEANEDVLEVIEEQKIEKVHALNTQMIEIQIRKEDGQCQTEGKLNLIYQIPMELEMVKNSESIEVQTEFTVQQDEDIIILRSTGKNPYEIVQIPAELIEPVFYEIPTEVQMAVEGHDIETQTEYEERIIQVKKIYEMPIEVRPISQTNQVQIQTLPQNSSNSSEQDSNSQQEKRQYEEEELNMNAEKRNNYRNKMSQQSFKKKKPYSQYFTSRIFEIPVQVNLNNDKLSDKLLSTEVQTQASELNPVLDTNLSNVLLSRQRQIIVSHLRIVPAFEPLKLMSQQANVTPVRRSPQKKIFRLSSQNDTLGVNPNFSNVHSMTPNQLDGSTSYDKFPVPVININNISLIKKSSFHSQGKFFGSLDMREELLNHDEALESVRMANRKLAGFEQGQSSSEQEDVHNLSRQMIIQQNQTIVSRDINRIQTPNLEPHDLNFSEYATLRQKFYSPQEEKINYQQLYDNAQTEIQGLKQKLYKKGEQIAQLKLQIDREECKYEQEIRKINEQLTAVHKLAEEQEIAIQGYKNRIAELEETKVKLDRKIEMLFENWQRLKDENQKGEIASNKEFQRLRGIISQKLAEIKQLRADEHAQKEAFEGQLHQYREVARQKANIINQLEEQLQQKQEKIEALTDKLEQMRKNMSHNNEADTAAIYQQQFERVKQHFEDQKRELNYQYLELKEQNEQLKQTIAEEQRKREELEATIADLEREVKEARQEYSNLHHLKSELQNNFMEGVKGLNQELQEMKDLVREKDEIIQHYSHSKLHSSPHEESSPEQTISKFRIQYISKQTSLVAADNTKHIEAYSRKLENLLKKYERIIIQNQGRIEQLQEKVYEYLKDALQKEQEAQGLYMKLVDYENTINNILVQKVTLDIENKRLAKQIELSQKKLNVLGTRLIQVARNRAEYDSDEDYYYD